MYYTKSGLQHHQRQVHSPGCFPCPECTAVGAGPGVEGAGPTTFSTKYDLLSHRRSAHGGAAAEKCSVCSARFPGAAELREHRVQCHSNRPFACPRCPHRSKTRDKLERHLVRHASRDAFRCAHCHKTFAFKNSLKKHLEKGRCAVLKQRMLLHPGGRAEAAATAGATGRGREDGEEKDLAMGQLRRLLAERPDLQARQQAQLQLQQQQQQQQQQLQMLAQPQPLLQT